MTAAALADPAVRRLVVTGHPNHELAILGFVQRLRPRLLFLTDGGGAQRVAESRQALDWLGLLDHARFLPLPETALYRALLDRDLPFFAALAAEVRREIEAHAPAQVLCESVEHYNPLHDLTLPLVRAATRGMAGVEVVEFPLIAQLPGPGERYRVQRLPAPRQGEAIELRLTAAELAAKLEARDHRYTSLRGQLGGVLESVADEDAGLEVFAPAVAGLAAPGPADVLRYERRGRLLQERGEVERVITYREHYLPIAAALTA